MSEELVRRPRRADELAARLKDAVEALEFYADKAGWEQPPVRTVATILGPVYEIQTSKIQRDRGERARAFFARVQEGRG